MTLTSRNSGARRIAIQPRALKARPSPEEPPPPVIESPAAEPVPAPREPTRKSRLPCGSATLALRCPYCGDVLGHADVTASGWVECGHCWNTLPIESLRRQASQFHGRLVLDVVGHFVTSDDSWLEVALASGAKLGLPSGWLQVIHPKDRALFAKEWRSFMEQEAASPGQDYRRTVTADFWLLQRRSKPMRATMGPLRAEGGELIGYEIVWRGPSPKAPPALKPPRRSLLWAAGATVVITFGAVAWLAPRGNSDSIAQSSPPPTQTAVDVAEGVPGALLGYLEAARWEDKARWVRGGEASLDTMKEWAGRGRAEPKIVSAGQEFPQFHVGGKTFHQGTALDEFGQEHPYVVERVGERWLLDWKSWVGYSEMDLADFIRRQESHPIQARVLGELASYHNFSYDEKDWICLALRDNSGGGECFAYAPRTSALGQEISRFFVGKPAGQAYRLTLALAFEDVRRGPNQARIQAFQRTWVDGLEGKRPEPWPS